MAIAIGKNLSARRNFPFGNESACESRARELKGIQERMPPEQEMAEYAMLLIRTGAVPGRVLAKLNLVPTWRGVSQTRFCTALLVIFLNWGLSESHSSS